MTQNKHLPTKRQSLLIGAYALESLAAEAEESFLRTEFFEASRHLRTLAKVRPDAVRLVEGRNSVELA